MLVWIDRKSDDPTRHERVRAALADALTEPAWRWQPPALIAPDTPGPYPTDVHTTNGVTAIYWGELFNADALRKRLTATPTNEPIGPAAIVWRLYAERGAAGLEHLNGQFAFIAWDAAHGRLTAAADRWGFLPLRYYIDDTQLVVATRADLIRRCPGVNAPLSPQAIYDYVCFAMIPAPATVYRNIVKIGPRQLIEYDGQLRVRSHSPLRFPEDARRSRREMYRQTHAVIERAIARRVPDGDDGASLGAFLSGGLDSSTVLGKLCERLGRGADAFTIGFDEPRFNEMQYARVAAQHFDARLHEHYVTPEHTLEAIDEILAQYDEPFGNASAVAVYHCAKFARQSGKSYLLAGDGGDEIFAGNPQYMTDKVLGTYQLVPWILRRALIEPVTFGFPFGERVGLIRKARKYIRRSNIPNPERLFSYGFIESTGSAEIFDPAFLETIDEHHPMEVRRRHYEDVEAVSEVNRVLHVDLNLVVCDSDLRKVTEMSARAGVRVSYPMLDPDVVALAGSLPGRWLLRGYRLRAFYKEAMEGYLPAEIIAKKKHGFGLPFSAWLGVHPGLRERMREAFSDESAGGVRVFRRGFLPELVRRYEADETNYYGSIIWVLMMLLLWLRRSGTGR